MNAPTFIGIGVQKCASTWIHRILGDHPEVAVSTRKEIDFFSCNFESGFHWYEKHFVAGKVCGENSPSYFCNVQVPQRIFAYKPDMRIIVSLRDPVERIISHHAHEIRLDHVDSRLDYSAAMANNPMYIEQSRYAKYLKHWLTFFPREQLLILLQEEIKQNPASVARMLYEFIGVEPGFRSEFLHRRVNVSQKPGMPLALAKRGGAVLRRIGLENQVAYLKRLKWVEGFRNKNVRDIRRELPVMIDEELRVIDESLKDDLMELDTMIDADLNLWPSWRRIASSVGGNRDRGRRQPVRVSPLRLVDPLVRGS